MLSKNSLQVVLLSAALLGSMFTAPSQAMDLPDQSKAPMVRTPREGLSKETQTCFEEACNFKSPCSKRTCGKACFNIFNQSFLGLTCKPFEYFFNFLEIGECKSDRKLPNTEKKICTTCRKTCYDLRTEKIKDDSDLIDLGSSDKIE